MATLASAAVSPHKLAEDREDYEDAIEAVDQGNWTAYQRLRPGLEDYPLAIYLDYFQLTGQSQPVRATDALRFMEYASGSPLPNRFAQRYLARAGREGRWGDFLRVQPTEPASTTLQCYFYRAKLATGDTAAAWDGARQLWDHGQSRPDACDPLFAAWMKADQLTDDVVWSRQVKAFEARQRSLMSYAARRGSPALDTWSDKLLAVYRSPEKMRRQSLPADSPYSADIASLGLALLARYNPPLALDYWQQYQSELVFSAAQQQRVDYAIAQQGLFAKSEALLPWLPDALARLQDDRLIEIRLRWALAEADWDAMSETMALLSDERRESDGWRYWQAVLLEKGGDNEAAQALFTELAKERSYHGFLAADRLGQPYVFNHNRASPDNEVTDKWQREPTVQRVGELQFHESYDLAHSEWYYLLQDVEQLERREELAQLAASEGWHRMAIDAAARARAWDALDLRFPMPHQDTFARNAVLNKVSGTELMAIARRESAFHIQARSPVGARGLMQLMPATGREVASRLGAPSSTARLYDVEHNVQLGSAYYRQLLDRFGGNRVYALAAYNAGPHRVDRWRSKPGEGVAVDVWIDTIPFKETREYVQAVLAYNVVFQYLMGDTRNMLAEDERHERY
ncbi:MAG: transglycosylase SLT domain-containing protein [Pseudomonadota bacterium]